MPTGRQERTSTGARRLDPPTGPPEDARAALREERFSHAGLSLELVLPPSAEALIDPAEFATDERLPYWAEVWPAARALARWALEQPSLAGPALELGCGVALPSLALRARGIEVVATDYYADALHFATRNAVRNRLAPLATRLVDWREPPTDLGVFPLVIAADVLYEARNIEPLATLLTRVVTSGGTAILADPGRVHLAAFRTRLRSAHWLVETLDARREPSPAGGGRLVEVELLRISPPPCAQRPGPKL